MCLKSLTSPTLYPKQTYKRIRYIHITYVTMNEQKDEQGL